MRKKFARISLQDKVGYNATTETDPSQSDPLFVIYMKRTIRNAMVKITAVRTFRDFLLIEKAKKGDKDAFGKLYSSYLDAIYRYVFFRVENDRQTAEDITEEIFLKAWRHIDQFKIGTGTVQAWLYKIASTTVIDHHRTKKQQVNMHEEIADESTIEEQFVKKTEQQQITRALKTLTDEQQSVIIMKFINDLSNKEIARVLNMSNDAVRALQYRALKNLRKKLKNL